MQGAPFGDVEPNFAYANQCPAQRGRQGRTTSSRSAPPAIAMSPKRSSGRRQDRDESGRPRWRPATSLLMPPSPRTLLAVRTERRDRLAPRVTVVGPLTRRWRRAGRYELPTRRPRVAAGPPPAAPLVPPGPAVHRQRRRDHAGAGHKSLARTGAAAQPALQPPNPQAGRLQHAARDQASPRVRQQHLVDIG